jgi:hypothetical protein
MIERAVRQTLGSGSPRAYAAAMADLWIDLHVTLARLDRLADDTDFLQDDRDTLPTLQYELHRAGELAAGLAPPNGAELVHEELTEALAEARELTAEIAAALEHAGLESAAPLVWEWRGALFRVRFARIRLERNRPEPAVAERVPPPPARPSLLAAGAVAVGSALVLVAALLGLWLLVAFTLTGTIAGSVLLRP